MMKRDYKIVVLILSAVMFLTACNSGETVTERASIPIEESGVEENRIEERHVDENNTQKDTEEINLDDDWYTKNLWYRGTLNTNNIIHIKEDNYDKGLYWLCAAYSVICQFYPDSASEITAENLGQGIRYVYDDGSYRIVLDYFPDTNQILLAMPLGSPHTGTKYDYSDLYEFDADLTEKSHDLANDASDLEHHDYDKEKSPENDVMDGRQFECFETESGEDVIISFRTSWDNSLMCVINEEYYVTVSYSETLEGYEGYPDDDVNSHIIIKLNEKGDLEFTSSGQYGVYSGTYIELPDSGTDGEN